MQADPSDDDHRRLIIRLFYLLTITAEDAAELAVAGQAPGLDHAAARQLASRLQTQGEALAIVAQATAALLAPD